MKYIKLITASLGLVFLSVLAFSGIANAQSFKTGDTITVAVDETIDGMLFASGNNIDIAGEVNGDVYCAGQTVIINGIINGDVFCAAQTITINGSVDGSVRLAGQSVTLSGSIGNSATVASQNLTIGNDGAIGRDLLGGSQNTTINGIIKRDIVAGANSLTVNGQVNRNIKGSIESIEVGSTGRVEGFVEYTGTNDPTIKSGGKIVGKVTRTQPPEQKQSANYAPMAFSTGWFMYSFVTLAVFAIVLVSLFPRIFKESFLLAQKTTGQTALIGLCAMILTPALIIIFLITLVGVPLAALVTLIWIITIILSGPFVAYMLGRLIMRDSKQPIWIMIVGTGILTITFFIPIIGFLTMMATHIFGTGMILAYSKKPILRLMNKKI